MILLKERSLTLWERSLTLWERLLLAGRVLTTDTASLTL